MKYIALVLLLTTILISTSWAGPWLPKTGEYQIYTSFVSTDNRSKKSHNIRKNLFLNMQQSLNDLANTEKQILESAEDQNRRLLNSEIRTLEEIDTATAAIRESMDTMKAFNDKHSNHISIEYGLSNTSSMGSKISFNTDRVFSSDDCKHKTLALLYYKYNFYNKDHIVATIQPGINISDRKKDYHSNYTELLLSAGRSRRENSYYNAGLGIRQFFNSNINHDTGFVFHTQKSTNLKKGVYLDNFAEYQYIKGTNKQYNSIVYLQSSLNKKWYVNALGYHLNTQIGYFWKRSVNSKYYEISGPMVSLWLNI